MLRRSSLARAALLAVTSSALACSVSIAPYEDRACDPSHPCLPGSGRECIRQTCQLPWDGGVTPLPDPSTTGVVPGTTLTPSGPIRVTQAGRVLEGLDILGCVTIEADGVVLRNSRIRSDGVCTGPLLDFTAATGTVVEDVELDGTGHAANTYAVMGGEAILRRIHLHHAPSGLRIYGDRLTLEHSLIHELTSATSAGAFVTAGGSDYTLRHNVLEVAGPGDSVITLYSQDEAIRSVLAEANLINGAGWSVTAGGGNAALPTSSVRFLRNRFGRKFHARCGAYGPVTGFESGQTGNQWEGNVWDDTSEPVVP